MAGIQFEIKDETILEREMRAKITKFCNVCLFLEAGAQMSVAP